MANVFRSGSWWEKQLPDAAPIHANSASWLSALTALDVSEGNHLNASGQGHISLNVPDPGGQFDAPIWRVTAANTSYEVWSMGSPAPKVPLRWAPVSQGGTGEGLRIPEYAKTNYWIKPSNNTIGPNQNDSPKQFIDTGRGYVGWVSDTYWNKDTLRWECWAGFPPGLSNPPLLKPFSGGCNIYYLASYGIDSGDFNEATTSKPSFWPATLTGTGINPTTYQDEARNQGTGRGNNAYFRVVNYDDFIADGGLTHVCEVYLTATGGAGFFPMKGFETGRGGDIPEGARMRVKATFTDAQISTKLAAAGLTGARLAQAILFIKGFRDYGVYVGDNSGSNSRVKLEDKTQASAGGTNPWTVQTQDLQAFGWGDWEIIDGNYDPPIAVAAVVTPGAVALSGAVVPFTATHTTTVTPGALVLAGQSVTVGGATVFDVDPAVLTLIGASVSLTSLISLAPGAVTLVGASVQVAQAFTDPIAVGESSGLTPAPKTHGLHKMRKRHGMVR